MDYSLIDIFCQHCNYVTLLGHPPLRPPFSVCLSKLHPTSFLFNKTGGICPNQFNVNSVSNQLVIRYAEQFLAPLNCSLDGVAVPATGCQRRDHPATIAQVSFLLPFSDCSPIVLTPGFEDVTLLPGMERVRSRRPRRPQAPPVPHDWRVVAQRGA